MPHRLPVPSGECTTAQLVLSILILYMDHSSRTKTMDDETALATRLNLLAPGEVLELRNVIDKRRWGPGPWQDEPDLLAWRHHADPAYLCQITRNDSISGALMGYVAVPAGHPWHGKDYAELDAVLASHGGLTWCGEAVGGRWVFGFDCGHGCDYQPAMEAHFRRHSDYEPGWMRLVEEDSLGLFGKHNYRHLAYVRAIVEFLCEQLILIGQGLTIGVCRICGCTDEDCSECYELMGAPCRWVTPNLCSRCELQMTGGML